MTEKINRRKSDLPYEKPNKDSNVWPKQNCPAFTPRENATMNECWYCKYADFHLDKPQPLEVGICNWPKKVTAPAAAEKERKFI